MNQKEVLKKAFLSGKKLTARQIRGVYRISSPAKVVSRLRRDEGLPIYSRDGMFFLGKPRYDVIVKGYESLFGDPPAKVLAAGYRAVGA